jgi:hypothetical protein
MVDARRPDLTRTLVLEDLEDELEATCLFALDLDDVEPTRVRPTPEPEAPPPASIPAAADHGGAYPAVVFSPPTRIASLTAVVVSAVATLGLAAAAVIALVFV